MPAKGITLIGSPPIKGKVKLLVGSETKNWAAMAGTPLGVQTFLTEAVTVPGASLGDVVIGVSMSDWTTGSGVALSGAVTAADTVTVTAQNVSGASLDIPSGTLTVYVLKNTR